jgi:hypothetical protein
MRKCYFYFGVVDGSDVQLFVTDIEDFEAVMVKEGGYREWSPDDIETGSDVYNWLVSNGWEPFAFNSAFYRSKESLRTDPEFCRKAPTSEQALEKMVAYFTPLLLNSGFFEEPSEEYRTYCEGVLGSEWGD